MVLIILQISRSRPAKVSEGRILKLSFLTTSLTILLLLCCNTIHTEVLLQIREGEDHSGKISECRMLEFSFHLDELVSLGSVFLVNITSFPVNSILFCTDTGYYVIKTLYEELINLGLVIPTSRSVIDDESETAAAVEVIAMKEKMASSTVTIDKLRYEATIILNSVEDKNKKRAYMYDRKESLQQVFAANI